MSLLYLPTRLSALFLALSLGLHPEIARRFPPTPLGGAMEIRALMDGGGSED